MTNKIDFALTILGPQVNIQDKMRVLNIAATVSVRYKIEVVQSLLCVNFNPCSNIYNDETDAWWRSDRTAILLLSAGSLAIPIIRVLPCLQSHTCAHAVAAAQPEACTFYQTRSYYDSLVLLEWQKRHSSSDHLRETVPQLSYQAEPKQLAQSPSVCDRSWGQDSDPAPASTAVRSVAGSAAGVVAAVVARASAAGIVLAAAAFHAFHGHLLVVPAGTYSSAVRHSSVRHSSFAVAGMHRACSSGRSTQVLRCKVVLAVGPR